MIKCEMYQDTAMNWHEKDVHIRVILVYTSIRQLSELWLVGYGELGHLAIYDFSMKTRWPFEATNGRKNRRKKV